MTTARNRHLVGPTAIVVGGLSKRPRVVGDRIEARDILDLTVTIDHNVVDGAPATRFAADLRQLLHTAVLLAPAADQAPDRESSTVRTAVDMAGEDLQTSGEDRPLFNT